MDIEERRKIWRDKEDALRKKNDAWQMQVGPYLVKYSRRHEFECYLDGVLIGLALINDDGTVDINESKDYTLTPIRRLTASESKMLFKQWKEGCIL